jgi:hypothetical protein
MSNNIEKYDGEKDLNDTEVTVLPESEFVSDITKALYCVDIFSETVRRISDS